MTRYLLPALLPLALMASSAVAAGATTDGVGERIESVRKLLEVSSAARKIEGSDDTEAHAGLARARALHRDARKAADAGDSERASALLKEATRTLLESARLVDLERTLAKKREVDYTARMQSIEALRAAYSRIRVEKQGTGGADETGDRIDAGMREAEALRHEGDLLAARRRLDETYLVAKTAIDGFRGGETLTRSLDFATKQEEYDYELDRNDTHRMLIDLLLQDKLRENEGLDRLVRKFMDRSGELRVLAEQQAGRGDYELAVRTLEASTREIVRAIRSAGVYIPG